MTPVQQRNPVTGDVVLVAEERANRPIAASDETASIPNPADCPFCPGNEPLTPDPVASFPEKGDWQVRVVPNLYPAVADVRSHSKAADQSQTAAGIHEVIIESPRHVDSVTALNDDEVALVFHAYQQRMKSALQTSGIEFVQLFKNARAKAGASIYHTHSQLLALETRPPRVLQQVELAKGQECPICQWSQEDDWIVDQSDRWIAISPPASRFAYQVWVVPRVHLSNFIDCEEEAIRDLAILAKRVISIYERAFANPAYNLIVNSFETSDGVHLYLELFPRIATPGGFEWGSGAFINTVRSETAASFLRKGGRSSC